MWQSLLRNWVLGAARDHVRNAAAAAASDQGPDPQASEAKAAQDSVCHVAVILALSIEAGGLIDRLAGVVRTEGHGFTAREGGLKGRRVLVVESGAGQQAAERAAAAAILGHRPRWVIAGGFAGGLDERLARGDILMANEVADTGGQALAIDLKLSHDAFAGARHVHVGRLLTVDRVIESAQEKRALGQATGALAVDMESMAVARLCARDKIRFLAVRVISDAVDHTLPRDIERLVRKTSTAGRLGAAAGAILRRPASIKDMWQLKEDALVASERLAGFLVGVIEQLP